MVEIPVNHESESALGISTLKLAQRIIGNYLDIRVINLKVHDYIPHTHIENPAFYLEITKDAFLKMQQKDLNGLSGDYGEKWNVSLSSKIILKDNQESHLILADLALGKSKENLELIKNRFQEIIKPQYGGGFFLETGNSYHYFGKNVLNKDDWHKFLGSLLITSVVTDTPTGVSILDLVDNRHVGHSLRREASCLRLTTIGAKTFSPRVVDYI